MDFDFCFSRNQWADALSFSSPSSRELVIVYSGNTLGELKPCGCAKEEDQGGFERRLTYLKQVFANSKNILLVDTGDNFKEPSTRQGKDQSALHHAGNV